MVFQKTMGNMSDITIRPEVRNLIHSLYHAIAICKNQCVIIAKTGNRDNGICSNNKNIITKNNTVSTKGWHMAPWSHGTTASRQLALVRRKLQGYPRDIANLMQD